jgi:hypothetical protein
MLDTHWVVALTDDVGVEPEFLDRCEGADLT